MRRGPCGSKHDGKKKEGKRKGRRERREEEEGRQRTVAPDIIHISCCFSMGSAEVSLTMTTALCLYEGRKIYMMQPQSGYPVSENVLELLMKKN